MVRNGGHSLQFRVNFNQISQCFGTEGFFRSPVLFSAHPHQTRQCLVKNLAIVSADRSCSMQISQTAGGYQLHGHRPVTGHQSYQVIRHGLATETGDSQKCRNALILIAQRGDSIQCGQLNIAYRRIEQSGQSWNGSIGAENRLVFRCLEFKISKKFRSMIQVNTNVIITLQALVKMEVTEIWLQTDRGMSFNSCGTSLESANRRSVFVASF